MKIIFINPWTKSLFGDEKQVSGYPHLGLAYLVAVCKKNGYNDIKIFDQGLENNDELLFEMISSFGPNLVAITTFSYCVKYAEELIAKIKATHPELPTIVGGPHVSATKGHCLKNTMADYAMKNESELSFVNFLTEMGKSNPDYKSVKNLIWRDSDRIIENESEKFITDLDSLPLPDYEAFGIERYSCFKVKMMPIITSRGCPYRCNYCSIRLSMGRNFRARSPESIVAEMKHWIGRLGVTHFEINDDCFALDIKRAEAICDHIIDENLGIKYELYNGIRADNVTERLLSKMKKSGCVFISYGCESGNQEIVNKSIGKRLDLKKVVEVVDLTRKVGIKNSVNFIIGHPDETYKTAMETLRFARSLRTNFVNIYNLILYPGTELFDWIAKNASRVMPVEDYMSSVGSRDLEPIFETKEFTRKERIKVLKKGYALYERTVLRFRFGRFIGFCVYAEVLTRVYIKVNYKKNPFRFENLDLASSMTPNYEGIITGVTVKTNSYGLRNRPISPHPEKGMYRIACLGDSVTFGYGLKQEETYVKRLENGLNNNYSEAMRYEVINCGMLGYNTYQERLFLTKKIMGLKPELIILAVSLNDLAAGVSIPSIVNSLLYFNEYSFGDMTFTGKVKYITARNSFFAQYVILKFRALCRKQGWFQGEMVGEYGKNELEFLEGNGYELAQERFRQELLTIKNLTDKAEIALLVVVFPSKIQLKEKKLRVPQKMIADFCDKNDLIYLDMLVQYPSDKDEDIFIDTGHPSRYGSKLVAEAIFDALYEEGLL